VSNFVRNEADYGMKMKGGKKYVTTPSERRLILRTASNSHPSAGKIKEKCGLNGSVATVKRIIQSSKYLKSLKIMLVRKHDCDLPENT